MLGVLGTAAVAGMFKWLGQDPAAQLLARANAPVAAVAANETSTRSPAVFDGGMRAAPRPAPAAAPAPQAAPAPSVLAPAPPPSSYPAAPVRRVATSACTTLPCLPFLPGSEVLDDGNTNDGSPGQVDHMSWAATLSTSAPMADAVGYYRQQLASRQRPGDLAMSETSPGPGQVLLTVTTQEDGKQHSVWIGQAGPQVMIRLVTTVDQGR